MKRLSRLSQMIILAALLFSPAEGICLLPFPHVALDVETRNSSIGAGAFRYQTSIRRIEKDRGERPGKVSDRDSTDSGSGSSTGDKFLLRLAYAVSIAEDLSTTPVIKRHFLSSHKTRPPPLS